MRLSIVTSLYCSSQYVEKFYRRISFIASKLVDSDYEIIVVNDGSPDDSIDIVSNIAYEDSHVVVIDLSRNFGHHNALMAGLRYASGDRVFLIDIDLEEKPEWLELFYNTMDLTNVDLVYGVQDNRKGGWFEKWSGALYYKLFIFLTGIDQVKNQVTARLMTSNFKNTIIGHSEYNLPFMSIFYTIGYDKAKLILKKDHSSPTTYTFSKKVSLAFNSIVSSSDKPLRLLFYVGLMIFICSMLSSIFILFKKYIFGIDVEGWTSVIVSIWLLGGFVITQVGLCSMYISRIFIETKNRPNYIVRRIISKHRCDGDKK